MMEPTASSSAATAPLLLPELRARVYTDGVPDELIAEMPELYGSLYSSEPWFRIMSQRRLTGACVLDEPRHILAFVRRGDTVEILNRLFTIDATDAERACVTLLRALPQVRRVTLEVAFAPGTLRLPHRSTSELDDYVIDLPATLDDYHRSLGKSTRDNLRLYQNRLRKQQPDAFTEVIPPGDRAADMVAVFREWHLARFHDKGMVSWFESYPGEEERLAAIVRQQGHAMVTSIDGSPAAIAFLLYAGDGAILEAVAFDPRHEKLRLGLLTWYWAISDAIERGLRRFHMLWTTPAIKLRLGAHSETLHTVSVFRSRRVRSYYDARRLAGQALRRAGVDPDSLKQRRREGGQGGGEQDDGERGGSGRDQT